MAVSGTVLTPLIEEYFNLEEYPEGEPLEAERSLLQIVEYLKTKCNEKGLGEISDAKEILKSQMTREERKERNINDKVRRVLKKMHMIASTTGNTTKKRYYLDDGTMIPPGLNDNILRTFVATEIEGGGVPILVDRIIETVINLKRAATGYPPFTQEMLSDEKIKDVMDKIKDEMDKTKDEMDKTKLAFLSFLSNYSSLDGNFKHNHIESSPFKYNVDSNSTGLPKIENDSTKWFTNDSIWMGSQYYGFQGPDGLVSVIDNIRNNIVKADMTKISEGSQNIQKEIEWLKVHYPKPKQMNNRIIITLALLHLNRSLLESINR